MKEAGQAIKKVNVGIEIDVPASMDIEAVEQMLKHVIDLGLSTELRRNPLPSIDNPLLHVSAPKNIHAEETGETVGWMPIAHPSKAPPVTMWVYGKRNGQNTKHRITEVGIGPEIESMPREDLINLIKADGCPCQETWNLVHGPWSETVRHRNEELRKTIDALALTNRYGPVQRIPLEPVGEVSMSSLATHLEQTGRLETIDDPQARAIIEKHLSSDAGLFDESARAAASSASSGPSP